MAASQEQPPVGWYVPADADGEGWHWDGERFSTADAEADDAARADAADDEGAPPDSNRATGATASARSVNASTSPGKESKPSSTIDAKPSARRSSTLTFVVAGLLVVLAIGALGAVAWRHAHRVSDPLAVSDPQGSKACLALRAAFISTDPKTKLAKIVETSQAAAKSLTPEIKASVSAPVAGQQIADATKLRPACVALGYDIPETPNTANNPSPAATPGG